MKKTFAALALAALVSAPAFAAPETYVVDSAHTFPRFQYNHLGFSTQEHGFSHTTGTIVWDREARTASVDITIDATSIDAGSAMFNQHLQGEDFFDTAKYPTITFKSTAVRFDGDKPVAVDGNLTIKGITHPATLTLTNFTAKQHPMLKKDALGANATTKIVRSEFNNGKYAPYVSDEVTLNISVEAQKQ